jgi:hypothetical protein
MKKLSILASTTLTAVFAVSSGCAGYDGGFGLGEGEGEGEGVVVECGGPPADATTQSQAPTGGNSIGIVFSGALAVIGEERGDVEVNIPPGGSVTFSEESNRLVATIDAAVNALVRVPQGRALEVDGGDGAICIQGLQASLDVQAGTASVQAGVAPPPMARSMCRPLSARSRCRCRTTLQER